MYVVEFNSYFYLGPLQRVRGNRVAGLLKHYTDLAFWRREHHGMFLSRGLK